MTERQPPRPTDAELAILSVLWRRGPSTVREVHDELSSENPTGYTTVLKLLQIMTEKGLVVRDETERAHVYEPRYSEQKTQRQLLADLANRALDDSGAPQSSDPLRRSGTFLSATRAYLPYIVLTWLLGVALLSARLAGGWMRAQRLAKRDSYDASPEWQRTVRRLSDALALRRG